MDSSAPSLHHMSVSRTARYAQYGDEAASEWWVVLHGYGQRAADFIRPFADVAADDRCILAPEALSRFYTDGMASHQEVGASWMTREDRTHEIEDYIGYLDALVARVRLPETTPSIHVLGFSQGAATASRWAVLGDTSINRLTLWAGDLAHDIDVSAHATSLQSMTLTVVVGTHDPYISDERLQDLLDRLQSHHIPVAVHRFEGAHRLHRRTLQQIA